VIWQIGYRILRIGKKTKKRCQGLQRSSDIWHHLSWWLTIMITKKLSKSPKWYDKRWCIGTNNSVYPKNYHDPLSQILEWAYLRNVRPENRSITVKFNFAFIFYDYYQKQNLNKKLKLFYFQFAFFLIL